MGDFIPATTGLSRVFIIEGRAGPENVPDYHSCVRAQALSQSFGEITDIECPDPTRPGQYVKIGSFQGAVERATISLEGRYALDMRSALMRMAKNRCDVDVQIHFGDCEDLSDHNAFKKVLFLHKAQLSAYNTEDLGSLASGDTAAVNESVDLSALEVFDIIPATWGEKGGDLVTTEILDATICDEVSCGNCGDPSGGCNKAFALTKAAGGSPGTPADVVFTVDGGITWFAADIDSLGIAEDPNAIACVKGYLVVVAAAGCSAHYADLDEFDDHGTDPAWTEVAVGFEAGACPHAIVSVTSGAFIVGENGHIYWMEVPSNGVTVLEDGTLTSSTLNAVAALNEHFVVAVGNDGTILWSADGEVFQRLTTPPVGVGVDFLAVAVKSKTEWWVGTDVGNLYYTTDAGVHWTLKAFPQSGAGSVNDIAIANDSIMYLAYTYTTPAPDQGRIYASFNGGYDWVVMPLGTGLMPSALKMNTVAPCPNDPELVVAGGLRTGTDGIIVVGKM